MGSSVSKREFTYSYSDEPHATRRKLILQKHPQVKQLMGIDEAFKWQVIALVTAQVSSYYFVKDISNFWALLILGYCISGIANHAIMLAIHEISHGMGFGTSRPLANKLFAIFANLPIGLPMAASFKKYHIEHHRYQGDELLDTDVPTHFEASFFTNSFKKIIWCILQPLFYTMRPFFVNPKPIEKIELLNIVIQVCFDIIVVATLGWHVLAYMIGSSFLAMGLHPVAGHFISEHTLMFENRHKFNEGDTSSTKCNKKKPQLIALDEQNEKQDHDDNNNSKQIGVNTVDKDGKFLVPETCSYYGPLNYLTFNVGYHVEHHDFPSIPGSRLHLLHKIAPEFYSNLNYHTSWTYVLWRYITDPRIGPSARVRRPHGQKQY